MSYLELIKPELALGLGFLIIGFIALGVYAIHVDKKRLHKQQNNTH